MTTTLPLKFGTSILLHTLIPKTMLIIIQFKMWMNPEWRNNFDHTNTLFFFSCFFYHLLSCLSSTSWRQPKGQQRRVISAKSTSMVHCSYSNHILRFYFLWLSISLLPPPATMLTTSFTDTATTVGCSWLANNFNLNWKKRRRR